MALHLIRTRLSGVWVEAEFLDVPEGVPVPSGLGFRIRGRRLYYWAQGDALACGDLAMVGVPEGSKIERPSEPVLLWTDVAEVHVMSEAAVQQTQGIDSWRA